MIMYGAQKGPRPIPVPEIIDPTTPEDYDDPEMSTIDGGEKYEYGFFEKLRRGNFSFHFPELDKFCFSGVVIDGATEEGQKAVDSGVETTSKEGKLFAAEHAELLQTKSEELKIKVQEGWATTVDTIQNLPETFKEKWAEAREIYHERKRIEAKEAKAKAAPPMPKEVTVTNLV